jgi:hypothetical protein
MATGIVELESIDTPKLRISFIFSVISCLTIFIFLLDFGLLVMVRNPIAAAIGSESKMAYTARVQPQYAQALALVNQTPFDAYVYLLNEPRSYGMNRRVQPDLINDNLPHDFYLYATNAEMINIWRAKGYTHVLAAKGLLEVDNPQVNAVVPEYQMRLEELMDSLIELERSTDGDYILFAIPPE